MYEEGTAQAVPRVANSPLVRSMYCNYCMYSSSLLPQAELVAGQHPYSTCSTRSTTSHRTIYDFNFRRRRSFNSISCSESCYMHFCLMLPAPSRSLFICLSWLSCLVRPPVSSSIPTPLPSIYLPTNIPIRPRPRSLIATLSTASPAPFARRARTSPVSFSPPRSSTGLLLPLLFPSLKHPNLSIPAISCPQSVTQQPLTALATSLLLLNSATFSRSLRLSSHNHFGSACSSTLGGLRKSHGQGLSLMLNCSSPHYLSHNDSATDNPCE